MLLPSEGNKHEHWRYAHKRALLQKQLIAVSLRSLSVKPPCLIRLTRISPRALDDDNLRPCLKVSRDKVADILIPGLKPGRADGDKRLQWEYAQERGAKGYQALRIDFYTTEGTYETSDLTTPSNLMP